MDRYQTLAGESCAPRPAVHAARTDAMRAFRATLCVVLTLAAAGCVSEMAGDGRGDGGIVQAAATPLRDVGLLRPDVPDALKDLTWPYALPESASEPTGHCTAVAAEIAAMDALLGIENYQSDEDQGLGARAGSAAGNYAVSTVADAAADVLPYRGWVRRLSGASKAERKAAAAYAMGEQRRTFLRGYAAGLGCSLVIPAPPAHEDAN